MGLRGSVKAFSLQNLLDFLVSSGHRGTLEVMRQDTRRTLYLYQGGLYLDCKDMSFRLGEALVRRGQVTAEQVDAALAQQGEGGGRLGDLLVASGATTEHEVMLARRMQIEEEIYELFSWEDATFTFELALPEAFEEYKSHPEEFQFPVRSVLMETTRRLDEWARIRDTLRSAKQIYVLNDTPDAETKARAVLVESKAQRQDPQEVFAGQHALSELPHVLGLPAFDTQALVTRLIQELEAVRPLPRQILEGRFREALSADMDYALKLYGCALESDEFGSRGRLLDKILLGSEELKARVDAAPVEFSARVRGRRAFEILLALLRHGVTCTIGAREDNTSFTIAINKSALILRQREGDPPPNIMQFVLARAAVSEADMQQLLAQQESSGKPLRDLLVNGGYVAINDWLRAQKDAVFHEAFKVFLLRRPFIEVRLGTLGERLGGLDVEVPLLPWLQAELNTEIRQYEGVLNTLPSVHAFLKQVGEGAKPEHEEILTLCDGSRTVQEVLEEQSKQPPQFFDAVCQLMEGGLLEPLNLDDYALRVDAAVTSGERGRAIAYCLAALETHPDAEAFRRRVGELRAQAEMEARTEQPRLRGDLASFSLAEVLQSFFMNKRSGTLKVEQPKNPSERPRKLYFDEGDVYLLTGDLDQEIGGDLTEKDLEAELVAAGAVTEDQLAQEAAQQMKEEVYEIFLWEGAEFEFAADQLPSEYYSTASHRKIRLNTQSFLLEAVRRSVQWEEVRQIIPDNDIVLSYESSEKRIEAISSKGSQDLLLLIDGRQAITDLVRMSGQHFYQTVSILAELVQEGYLKVVDRNELAEADEEALIATDLPTSGVIEPGFVGRLQFVGTFQDLSSAGKTGILRLTDGRRSKEIPLIDGIPHRPQPFTGEPEGWDSPEVASSKDYAQDVAECFSWSNVRFELLENTLPPRLEDESQRESLCLDTDAFFERFEEAGERWEMVGEVIPKDKHVILSDEHRDAALERAEEHPEFLDLLTGDRDAEEIGRLSTHRYLAMVWLGELFESGLVQAVDPPEADDEDWDLGL